jgi:hypothetical protein
VVETSLGATNVGLGAVVGLGVGGQNGGRGVFEQKSGIVGGGDSIRVGRGATMVGVGVGVGVLQEGWNGKSLQKLPVGGGDSIKVGKGAFSVGLGVGVGVGVGNEGSTTVGLEATKLLVSWGLVVSSNCVSESGVSSSSCVTLSSFCSLEDG